MKKRKISKKSTYKGKKISKRIKKRKNPSDYPYGTELVYDSQGVQIYKQNGKHWFYKPTGEPSISYDNIWKAIDAATMFAKLQQHEYDERLSGGLTPFESWRRQQLHERDERFRDIVMTPKYTSFLDWPTKKRK